MGDTQRETEGPGVQVASDAHPVCAPVAAGSVGESPPPPSPAASVSGRGPEHLPLPRDRRAGGDRRGPSAGWRVSRSVAVVAASAVLVLLVVHSYQGVFWPLMMALAIAYMLEPVVARLQRAGMGRSMAVSLVFTGAGAALVGMVAIVAVQGVRLAEQLRDPERGLEAAVVRLDLWLQETWPWLHSTVANRLGAVTPIPADGTYGPLQADGTGRLQSYAGEAAGLFGSLMETLAGGLGILSMLVLVPIYLIYLMAALPRIWFAVRTYLPATDRPRTLRVLHRIHTGMAAFLRGRVVIALLKGAVTAVGLAIVGIPLAGVIGLGAGLASVLPYIGPFLGLAAALGVTFGEAGVQMGTVVGVLVVFALAEILEGLWFIPWIMKEGVQLHPLIVIFCVVFWGSVLGVFGVFIAIPLTLVLRILYDEYVHPSVASLAKGPDIPPGAAL